MSQAGIFRRSAAGQQALDERDKRLGARLRALMLMAEGKPLAQVDEMARGLGAPADALEQLRALGFLSDGAAPATRGPEAAPAARAADVAPTATLPPEPPAPTADPEVFDHFRTASGMIRELAGDTMGLKGFFFILKVEKCGTLAELEQLLPDLLPAVRRQRGSQEATRIEKRLRGLLSGGG
jgi:hypothetical protein